MYYPAVTLRDISQWKRSFISWKTASWSAFCSCDLVCDIVCSGVFVHCLQSRKNLLATLLVFPQVVQFVVFPVLHAGILTDSRFVLWLLTQGRVDLCLYCVYVHSETKNVEQTCFQMSLILNCCFTILLFAKFCCVGYILKNYYVFRGFCLP